MINIFLGEEVEWVQCDTCENWYHFACVGISAQEASNIEEYLCPYCRPTLKIEEEMTEMKTPNIKCDSSNTDTEHSNKKNDFQNIPHLSVIAEVAHQLIADAENNKKAEMGDANKNSEKTANHVPNKQSLNLDSLICLADVSQKMDVASVLENTSDANQEKAESNNKSSLTEVASINITENISRTANGEETINIEKDVTVVTYVPNTMP